MKKQEFWKSKLDGGKRRRVKIRFAEPFMFRGLWFRVTDDELGLQGYSPECGWAWTIIAPKYLEKGYAELPDIELWTERRMSLGSIRFAEKKYQEVK